jgi:lipopolysaccharide assembly protein B
MLELLWLLVPLAGALGWYIASISARRTNQSPASISDEYVRGLDFLLNEQPDKALEVFIKIAEVDPDTVETHIVLGNLFRRRGEVDRAIRVHQNLVARPNLSDRHRADALLELGRDYLRAGLLDRAEALFKEVVHIGGQTVPAYRHLREIYEQEKDWSNAIETAARLQHDCGLPQSEIIAHYYCELGEIERAQGRSEQASQCARKALGYDRACVRASILLGDLAAERGEYKQAIHYYSDVQTQRPEFVPLVLQKLKMAYAQCGGNDGYLALLRRIRQDNPSLSVVLCMLESLDSGDHAVDEIFAAELNRPLVPLKMIREFVQIKDDGAAAESPILKTVARALNSHLERQASHQCHRCGLEIKSLYWQCPSCHGWGTIKPADPGGDPATSRPDLARG